MPDNSAPGHPNLSENDGDGTTQKLMSLPLAKEFPPPFELALRCQDCGHTTPYSDTARECEACLGEDLSEWFQSRDGSESLWKQEYFDRLEYRIYQGLQTLHTHRPLTPAETELLPHVKELMERKHDALLSARRTELLEAQRARRDFEAQQAARLAGPTPGTSPGEKEPAAHGHKTDSGPGEAAVVTLAILLLALFVFIVLILTELFG